MAFIYGFPCSIFGQISLAVLEVWGFEHEIYHIGEDMKYSINDHSSIKIEFEDKIINFDPYLIRKKTNDSDLVFITHDHYDHFSIDDIKRISKKGTKFVCPKSCVKSLLDFGLNEEDIISLVPFEEVKNIFGLNLNVVAMPAYNMEKQFHPKENAWLGYIVEIKGARIYVTGDSDIDSKEIPLDSPARNVDYLFIPVGGTYTYDVLEASAFVNAIKPKTAIPTHYAAIVGDKDDGKKFKNLVDPSINVDILI